MVYYAWMDTTVNNFLVQHAGFVPTAGTTTCDWIALEKVGLVRIGLFI